MNEPCMVDWCDRPVGDGYVCQHCGDRLARALGDVPALWEELDITLTRQARYSEPEGRGGERSLPFNLKASDVGRALSGTLNTWCRLIAEERGKDLPEDHPPTVARWMLHHVTWLRHHRAGADAVDEIVSAVNKVRWAVDRPPERIYAGPCQDCGGDLYAKPDAAQVECRPCGVFYDVAEMVSWMRTEAQGRLVTAKEGALLLCKFGYETTRNRIDLWHFRKLIAVAGHDPEGRNLFSIDALIERAAAVNATPIRRVS